MIYIKKNQVIIIQKDESGMIDISIDINLYNYLKKKYKSIEEILYNYFLMTN